MPLPCGDPCLRPRLAVWCPGISLLLLAPPPEPPSTREASADGGETSPRPVHSAWGLPREGPAAPPASLGHSADSPESREAPSASVVGHSAPALPLARPPVPATAGVARSTGAPCVLLPGAGPAAGGGVTRRPCAHLSSWKLATPRWKKPTAMQASLVSAWSNAWGQRGPCNAKVCDPITPQPRQVASDGARAFHLPVVASLAALRACVQLRQQGGVTNPCVRHGDEKARPGQSALGVQMGRLWS